MKNIICAIAVLFLLAACSKDKAAEEAAPPQAIQPASEQPAAETGAEEKGVFGISIAPGNPYIGSPVTVTTSGFDISKARIVWMVNGNPVSTDEMYRLVPSAVDAHKGDEIQAKAIIDNTEVTSNIVKILNSIPELTHVKIIPEIFKPGDTVGVEVETSDADGDPITIEYAWTKNGLTEGTGPTIGTKLQRGDTFSIKVIPFDGEEYGQHVLLERKVLNFPPEFTQSNKFEFDGKIYTYQANATDADGDPIKYSLKEGPKGMSVDPATGAVKWEVPLNLIGTTAYTLLAEDGNGGVAEMTFNFTLTPEKKEETR